MQMLPSPRWAAAVEWLYTYGRPVDRALFACIFRQASTSTVLHELAVYQNPDGGFGHGLEPDLRTPASSVIATTQAFGLLRRLNTSAGHPLVRSGMAYYLATYEPRAQRWPIAFADVEDAPHAPWWTYANLAGNYNRFGLNPTAVVVGHLYDYPELVPEEVREGAFTALLRRARSQPDPMEMHDVLALMDLADARGLSPAQRAAVVAQVERSLPAVMLLEPAQWDGYGIRPLDVAPAPGARFAGCVVRDLVEQQLDGWIESQQPDGAWPIPWSWEQVDATAWRQAKHAWQGRHIVERLATLAAYGRVVFDEVYQSATLPSAA